MQKKLMLHKKQFCVERKKKQFDIAQKANWCQQKKLDTAQKHSYLLKKCINCFLHFVFPLVPLVWHKQIFEKLNFRECCSL